MQLSEGAINLFWWRPKFHILFLYLEERKGAGVVLPTSQELRMPSIVTINSQVTKVAVNSDSEMSVLKSGSNVANLQVSKL